MSESSNPVAAPPTVEELQKYVVTLQSDVTKLQIQLFKSEETVKKLQELNTLYCKVLSGRGKTGSEKDNNKLK